MTLRDEIIKMIDGSVTKQSIMTADALLTSIKELLPKENPYPENVFIPMTAEQLQQVHQLLTKEMNIPLDRVTGDMGRRTWDITLTDIHNALFGGGEIG